MIRITLLAGLAALCTTISSAATCPADPAQSGTGVPLLQLEFVFSGPNFDQMLFLNDSTTPSGTSRIAGKAKKY